MKNELENYVETLSQCQNAGFIDDERADLEDLLKMNRIPNTPEAISGVYVLFNGDEVVYVGQTRCIPARIGTHINEGCKIFDSYTVIKVPPELRILRERQLIATFRPKYNMLSLLEQGYMHKGQLQDICPDVDSSKLMSAWYDYKGPRLNGCVHVETFLEQLETSVDRFERVYRTDQNKLF